MTLYCGIDLHANNSVVVVLDEQDRSVYEKRLPNDLAIITEALCLYQSELEACVVESWSPRQWESQHPLPDRCFGEHVIDKMSG